MKPYFLILFFGLISWSSFAQIQGEDEVYLNGDMINPKFNGGGLDAFYAFIDKEFDNSKVTKPGQLLTSFNINALGEIKDIRILKFPNEEAAAEMIRVLKKSPLWQPAKKGGKAISTAIKIPLNFNIKK